MIKYCICLISLTLSLNLSAQSAKDFNYNVPGNIPRLKQPKDMDCWITVVTMMLSWRDSTNYSIADVLKKLGEPWQLYFDTDAGLPEVDQQKLVTQLQLKSEPPANYLISAYFDFLKRYGPLWIITGNWLGAHARLLIGLEDDGNNLAKFIFIDPLKGQVVSQKASAFFAEFEAEAKIANQENWDRLRIQIYHFNKTVKFDETK